MSALAERLDKIEQKFDLLLGLYRENNDLLRGQIEEATKPFLDHEDMRKLFGWPATKSNRHKRKLTYLRDKHKLTKFSSRRPYMYERKEAEEVARKLATGQIDLPRL